MLIAFVPLVSTTTLPFIDAVACVAPFAFVLGIKIIKLEVIGGIGFDVFTSRTFKECYFSWPGIVRKRRFLAGVIWICVG